MNKLLVSAAALTAMAGVASAADLPARAPAAAPAPVVAPVFTWTGFYVGVNVGAAFNDKCNSWTPFFAPTPPAGWVSLCNSNTDDVAFTGGGQIGYNWQMGAFVFGLEADINGIAKSDGGPFYVARTTVGAPFGVY